MMARHWRRWAKTKLQALLRAWHWRSAGGFEMWLWNWEIVWSLWVWSLPFRKSYLDLFWLIFFLTWCECILNKTVWSCSLAWEVGNRAQQVFCWDTNSSCGQQLSFPWRMDPAQWCGSTENEKLCRFLVGSGPLFLLSIFWVFLSFGNLQVVGWQATNGSFHWHVPAEEGLGMGWIDKFHFELCPHHPSFIVVKIPTLQFPSRLRW